MSPVTCIYSIIAIRALDARYQAQLHHPDPDLDPLLQVIVIAPLDRLIRCLVYPPNHSSRWQTPLT